MWILSSFCADLWHWASSMSCNICRRLLATRTVLTVLEHNYRLCLTKGTAGPVTSAGFSIFGRPEVVIHLLWPWCLGGRYCHQLWYTTCYAVMPQQLMTDQPHSRCSPDCQSDCKVEQIRQNPWVRYMLNSRWHERSTINIAATNCFLLVTTTELYTHNSNTTYIGWSADQGKAASPVAPS